MDKTFISSRNLKLSVVHTFHVIILIINCIFVRIISLFWQELYYDGGETMLHFPEKILVKRKEMWHELQTKSSI